MPGFLQALPHALAPVRLHALHWLTTKRAPALDYVHSLEEREAPLARHAPASCCPVFLRLLHHLGELGEQEKERVGTGGVAGVPEAAAVAVVAAAGGLVLEEHLNASAKPLSPGTCAP